MKAPPAARPHYASGSAPASAGTLSKQKYDVRSADGRTFLFRVSAEDGERGIAAGIFELAQARSGAYLRRAALSGAVRRIAAPRTWTGRAGTGTPSKFEHNHVVCNGFAGYGPALPPAQ